MARQAKLAARPDSRVSENCRKKREERRRLKDFKAQKNPRTPHPTVEGERQFGERAKGWHLHQRTMGLARALTPREFQTHEERLRTSKKKVELEKA